MPVIKKNPGLGKFNDPSRVFSDRTCTAASKKNITYHFSTNRKVHTSSIDKRLKKKKI